MKKRDRSLWLLVPAALFGAFWGFHDGGGYGYLPNGTRFARPTFDFGSMLLAFVLAWGVLAVVPALWDAVKEHVIEDYERDNKKKP